MATLTEVSGIARKTITFGITGIIVLMLLPVLWGVAKKIYLAINPPPPPPPTVRYGKLPPVEFPDTVPSNATPEYKLETIEGGLPSFAGQGKVYIVGINKSRLLTLDRVKQKMKAARFYEEPEQLDDQRYRFTHTVIRAEAIYNIISGGFTFWYDWTRDEELLTQRVSFLSNAAIGDAKSFLNRIGSLPDDLANGTTKVTYLVASGSALRPTNTLYEANFARVDLFRADKDEMKVVTAGGDSSPVNVLLSSAADDRKVVQAAYHYSQVIENDFSTYPLRGVDTAWQQLQAGQAFIVKESGPKVTVRRVTMAYFESNVPQQFMQPVYVFEGDNGFMAYVPAVREDYLDQAAAN